ncbi:mRNA turnover 4 [Podochytrium sp. JEL0797]|nr:mRNA turnover 4 [Podochytrium sp. JEL0797]
MAKSRRNKVMTMTKTEKKGRDAKTIMFEKVRAAADSHPHCYVISVSNMRNSILKAMRMGMKVDNTTFFFGNNRVIAKALGGPDREHEYKEGLRFVGEALKGEVGLCFSDLDVKGIRESFSKYVHTDFARNGVHATHTITLPAGPVMRRVEALELDETVDDSLAPSYLPESKDEIMAFPNNMETQLRGLGMPTLLKGGVIMLMREYTLCTAGDALTTNQAQLLKHFNLKMAKFNVGIVGHWSEEGGWETVDGADADTEME